MLTDSIKEQIRIHALSRPNEEVCGIIVDGQAIALPNIAPDRSNDFACVIDRKADAIYHSHCSDMMAGELSLEDIERCKSQRDKLPYILYHSVFDVFDLYNPTSPNPFPLTLKGDPSTLDFYTGWRFVWGRSDCFGLIRSYFLGMHGLDIGDFRRPTRKEQRTFPQPDYVPAWNGEKNGFVLMPRGETIRNYDVIEIAQRGGTNSNHIAVIVNDTGMQMLHSPSLKDVSKVELYGDFWQSRTTKHFRHKNFI